VTILEAGRPFRPLSLSVPFMETMRNLGLLFGERVIELVFRHADQEDRRGHGPRERCRHRRHHHAVRGQRLRMDEPLRQIGIRLDREFEELAREVPRAPATSGPGRRPRGASSRSANAWACSPTHPEDDRLRQVPALRPLRARVPNGAKWDSRRFLDTAIERGAGWSAGAGPKGRHP